MRQVLRFKPRFLDLVLEGHKTATIRPAKGAKYARELILTDGRRRVRARLVSAMTLTLRAALRYYKREGFSSLKDLREAILRIYPHLKPNSRVDLIEFRPSEVRRKRPA